MMATGGGVIGALRVILGADTAEFEKGLKRAETRAAGFAGGVQKSIAAAGLAISAAGAAIGLAVNRSLENADKMGKLAQSIGVPVEHLSRLAHAADLSGVSLESLGKGVGRLNRNIVEAAQGLSTPVRAFDALGIAIHNADGSLKNVSEILPEIAEKFVQMRDGPEKTALAMQLLGRAGADLIPMLNLGAQGLRDMMTEADELGLVIDEKTAKAAENFNDNLTRLARVKDGIITQLTARLAPALERLSVTLLTTAKDAQSMATAGDNLLTVLRLTASGAAILGGVVSAAWQQVSGLAGSLKNLISGDFGAAFDSFLKGSVDMVKTVATTVAAVKGIWSELTPDDQATSGSKPAGVFTPVITNANEASAALKRQQDVMREGLAVFQETRTPLETLSEQMARLNMLVQTGSIDWETYQRAASEAAANSNIAMAQSGQAIATAMGGAVNEAIGFLNQFAGKNKAAAIAAIALSKGVAIAQTIQSTAAAAAAAFLPPPIGAGPLAGAGLASAIKAFGAVQVGLIAATGIAQAASVGNRSVSASSSGGGSTSQSSEPAQTSISSGKALHITIQGRGFFSRDDVQELLEGIGRAVNDGVNSPFVVKVA
jgi:hypothetical protein